MPAPPVDGTTDDYLIRTYEPSDLGGFLSLYESVFGQRRSEAWVQWRYGGPYTDGIRMVVAERDGELVGAEPFISFEMRAGAEWLPALQPADAMVHPAHRRNGLLTRMTEHAIDAFANGDGFFFNFPNEGALEAYLRLGWRKVGTTATAYRIHRPSAFAGSSSVGTVTDAGAATYYAGHDAASQTVGRLGESSGPTVRRFDQLPADLLERLDRRGPADRIHAPRTAEFYRWRLGNPEWDVTTYVAESAGGPVAALLVCTEPSNGATMTRVVDALPPVDADHDALERLLRRAVTEHRDADAVTMAADTLPASVATRFGFLRNDRVPLTLLTSPDVVVARPFSLGGRGWSPGDRRLVDRSDWRLSFLEQDSSS
jgi:GNAT superfamily N-acetyltransferase